ncbi:APG9-domain-containing protein, partial [Myriangium duriaei CBS 260.36]
MEARKAGDESPGLQFQPEPPRADKFKQQWTQAQEQQQLFQDRSPPPAATFTRQTQTGRRPRTDRKEQALWMWTNVVDVDGFLLEVYQYYTNHGIYSILLSRLLYVLTSAFLFSTYMFLSTCVDYTKIPSSKSTGEILIPKCMEKTSFFKSALLWVFIFSWAWTAVSYITDIGRLWQLHDFYHYLLGIPDSDIQSIAWEKVVESLMSLRDANPETAENVPRYLRKETKTTQSKQRMDAHDIANRIMRHDNYYVALINKEILDLQLHLPLIGPRQFYSKSLEWCISTCFDNFIFDAHGHVQQHCLDPKLRLHMIKALRTRLRFAAVMSIVMAPFNITLQCIHFFSRYYAEFRNSPAQLGARAFTPLAEWKMRDFNELDHDFKRRLKMAYPFADRYLAQFPRDKTIQLMHFVSLIAGTVAAVLGIASLLDPELFLGFEVTPNRTAFFYLTISMTVFATARGAIPDDSEVHEPVLHLFEVIEYTHYAPQRWRNNFHTPAVRAEFSALYQMKVLIFLEEILSLIAAPFILWRNAGRPSAAIIDFFRQNTVHVDGLGGLCNHAVFEFRKRNKPEDDDAIDPARDLRDEYFGVLQGGGAAAKDQKMAQSQYYFM